MNRHFDTVTIIGVGLLGGSLGLALKARGLAATIRGVGHRQASLDEARAVGVVDETYFDAREATEGADLVVICTPAAAVPQKMAEILPACSNTTVVTDVASTKATICACADRTWPKPLRFVGSHPMAGSEKFGPGHAEPELYEGCVTIVATAENQAPDAREVVCDLWRAVGAEVIEVDPERHDAVVARTSHIPHILAACIAELAARAGDVPPFVGQGFRDVTRVAAGRPAIWRDICLTNREAILQGLEEMERQLGAVRRMVADGSAEDLDEFFRSARAARSKALGE